MTEIWKPIPGWERRYEVSDQGRVRSLNRRVWSPRGSGYWMTITGRIVGRSISEAGHPFVRLGETEERQVRYLVLEAFAGNAPGGRSPEHIDGDIENNQLSNLRWSDPLDALLDRAQQDEHGCWVYPSVGRNGYAAIGIDRRTIYGHRYAYERLRAEIPDDLVIDHLCRNRACVNPWHMEPVTQRTNVLRGARAGRHKSDQCRHGHAYTPENSYINPKGYRSCRTCRREQNRKVA